MITKQDPLFFFMLTFLLGSISAALSCLVPAGSFPEQRLVIEPTFLSAAGDQKFSLSSLFRYSAKNKQTKKQQQQQQQETADRRS